MDVNRPCRVLFVCLGNICRSPLAEGLFRSHLREHGLEEYFEADSCGTSGYHSGELPDPRTRRNAEAHELVLDHRARQLRADDFHHFDHILVMDDSNLQDVLAVKPDNSVARIRKMREHDHLHPGADVPDPWYGGEQGFEDVYHILHRSTRNLLESLRSSIEAG